MTMNAYLRLVGQNQGKIDGPVTAREREGTIAVQSYRHALHAPFDPASGGATGKRQHGPITVCKALDRTSPRLREAFAMNETFGTWVLQLAVALPRGADRLFATISLTQARIVSIDSTFAQGQELEEIGFVYRTIQWTIEDGRITAEDDWAPSVA